MNTIHHLITVRGPMSHGSFEKDLGNAMLFRRSPVMAPDGRLYRIPVLSAGALRGVVRRILWREVFAKTGLSRETMGEVAWDRLYAALCNGGTIEASESRVSPDTIRARRAAMPVLSLLGSALYTSHMAGLARVTNSWLVCKESRAAGLVSVLAPGCDLPACDLLAEESRVRHVDQEEQNPDVSNVGPMPTTIEVVIAGARLAGTMTSSGELEASAWAHGLEQVSHLGGKSAAGFGEVEIAHDGDPSLYRAWLEQAVADGTLRTSLLALAEELTPSKKAKKK